MKVNKNWILSPYRFTWCFFLQGQGLWSEGIRQCPGKTLDHLHSAVRPSHVGPERKQAWACLELTATTFVRGLWVPASIQIECFWRSCNFTDSFHTTCWSTLPSSCEHLPLYPKPGSLFLYTWPSRRNSADNMCTCRQWSERPGRWPTRTGATRTSLIIYVSGTNHRNSYDDS